MPKDRCSVNSSLRSVPQSGPARSVARRMQSSERHQHSAFCSAFIFLQHSSMHVLQTFSRCQFHVRREIMFEDSLMESTRHFSKRRGWITLLSSGLQMFVVAILVILPLLRTSAIPPQHMTVHPVLPYVSQPISSGSHPLSGTTDSGGITPVIVPMTQ